MKKHNLSSLHTDRYNETLEEQKADVRKFQSKMETKILARLNCDQVAQAEDAREESKARRAAKRKRRAKRKARLALGPGEQYWNNKVF
jgi:hypothetical protein